MLPFHEEPLHFQRLHTNLVPLPLLLFDRVYCAELLHFTEILNSRAYTTVENVGFVVKAWLLSFMVCLILTITLNLLRLIFSCVK